MRSPIELLPTLLALVHGHLVEQGVTIEVICTVETLSADLTEKYLVLWVWVSENVSLEQVLACEPLSTDLTGHSNVLTLSLAIHST